MPGRLVLPRSIEDDARGGAGNATWSTLSTAWLEDGRDAPLGPGDAPAQPASEPFARLGLRLRGASAPEPYLAARTTSREALPSRDNFFSNHWNGTHSRRSLGYIPTSLVLRGQFSLNGELMHAFVSYRVATEGPDGDGNGLSGLLAQKIRSLSLLEEGLQIPRNGYGFWPKGVKQPVPFFHNQAKVNRPCSRLSDARSARLLCALNSLQHLPPRATPSS